MGTGLEIFFFAATTVLAIDAQNDARRDRRRAEEAANRRNQHATQRQRIKNVRQGRIQRAQAEAASTSGEGTGGSGLLGTTQTLFQQQSTNLAFLDQQQQFSSQISDFNASASKSAGKASTFGGLAGATSSIFDLDESARDLFT